MIYYCVCQVLPIAYSSLAPMSTWRVKDDGSVQDSAKGATADAANANATALAAALAAISTALR